MAGVTVWWWVALMAVSVVASAAISQSVTRSIQPATQSAKRNTTTKQGTSPKGNVPHAAPFTSNHQQNKQTATPLKQRLEKARSILRQNTVLAGPRNLHWPLEATGRVRRFNSSRSTDSGRSTGRIITLPGLEDLRQAKVAGQMWSVQVPCDAQYRNAVQLLLEQLDAIKRVMASQARQTRLVTTTNEVYAARDAGVVGSLLSVGGGHAVGSSLGVLRSLPELGVSALSLTHTCPTPWAEAAAPSSETANTSGLTDFGKDLVLEMNRLGLLVDLAGSSPATAVDALLVSRSPVIFSNAFTKARCPTHEPSALPDTVIMRLTANRGVVLVALPMGDEATQNACGHNNSMRAAVEHINQVRKVAGIDHVGIGATDSSSRYSQLVAELLLDPAWSPKAIRQLLGANLIRALDEAHKVRDNMIDIAPSEELIPIHDIDDRWPCRYKFASLDKR